MAGVVNWLGDFIALKPDEKLFPHFSKPRTAIFTVKQIKYGRHDRAPSFDRSLWTPNTIPLARKA
jgi:hypothetical protein